MFKPMLAVESDLQVLTFPILASPKLDGVRAVVRSGVVYSRSNKPIPNKHIQKLFGKYEHFDGELIVGDPRSKSCYRDTVSEVMSYEKTAGCNFFVFDHVQHLFDPYLTRYKALPTSTDDGLVYKLDQTLITTLEHLLEFEQRCLGEGFEGLILRAPNAPYKMGRSTVREGYLLKLKRFLDSEAEIIGFEERMHNTNEATKNELGRTKRSSAKAGLVGMGMLGAVLMRTPEGVEFGCGTGFSDDERIYIWDHKDEYLGQLGKYKSFQIGVKDAPRHPVWLGLRDRRDL